MAERLDEAVGLLGGDLDDIGGQACHPCHVETETIGTFTLNELV